MSAGLATFACTATGLAALAAISADDAVGPLLARGVIDDHGRPFGGQVLAIAAPIPLDAPVTTATLPASFCDMRMAPLRENFCTVRSVNNRRAVLASQVE